jgi:starch synthase
LFATSEAVPFCKTGGLGDVCGSLPVELAKLGDEPVVVMPAFRDALKCGQLIESTGVRFEVPIGRKMVPAEILRSQLPDSEVPVYLVRQDAYFDRPGVYGEHGTDYKDNCERFVFYCRSVLEVINRLDLRTQILHCHDWTSGLIPAYLKAELAGVPPFESIATVYTIHNLAYQGNFWHWDMELTGLDWKYFNWRQMEFYGNLSFMKTALAFADTISTVSPTYAREIQSPPLGCGMEGILYYRRNDLSGIINGVDYGQWNPATDPHLNGKTYDGDSFVKGKAACKAALQREMGLPESADKPIVAFVGRLVDQKGVDLIVDVMQRWATSHDAQWVVLGTGEQRYLDALEGLDRRYPQKIAVRLDFSNDLAHRIEAGADIFAMPSRYEPCGLNQLYSLKYGTVPVVHATGGLADTIVDCSPESLAAGKANGFSFHDYNAATLALTLQRALDAYRDRPTWEKLVRNGMRQDWSWGNSARQYVGLYSRMLARSTQAALP